MILLEGRRAVETWLAQIGAGDQTATQLAKRAYLSAGNVWASLKRGKLSDEVAVQISRSWVGDPFNVIAYATGIPAVELVKPPQPSEQVALLHPGCLLSELEGRWARARKVKRVMAKIDLAWAEPRSIAGATFQSMDVSAQLRRLSEQMQKSQYMIRTEFMRKLSIRTALAAAEATGGSYALFLLATGRLRPEDYNLNLDTLQEHLRKTSILDLATLTAGAVKAYTRVISEAADPEEDAYR